ncbi:hypothetical protein [Aquibacillus sediminis]|uniref:hypothetical protein n=1 Tax=Aquibacillus sediminis TaxID=2574734 RepID=UPI001108FE3F|nr:hypothetical protein [Aquibacillus sediminis]
MKLIDELIEQLITIVHEYKQDRIDHIEFQLQLQYLISRIDKVEINFHVQPLDRVVKKNHTKPFNQLLFKAKYHAIESILSLQKTHNRQALQAKLHAIILKNLYFESIEKLLFQSCEAYMDKNQLNCIVTDKDVFIYRDG